MSDKWIVNFYWRETGLVENSSYFELKLNPTFYWPMRASLFYSLQTTFNGDKGQLYFISGLINYKTIKVNLIL